MKKLNPVIVLILLLLSRCDDSVTNPPTPEYGVTGKIMNDSGDPIPGVKIYYLFNYYDVPIYSGFEKPMNASEADSFGYAFYQNFPNPVYNSAFMRYSIGSDMDVEFLLKEKNSGEVKYNFSGFYYYGLYQYHFDEIVSNLQLENGCYLMILKVSKNGTVTFESEKKMFVISDLGNPNAASDEQGNYFFDYNKAFIGDSIISTYDGNYYTPTVIFNQINLLLKKDGYLPATINVELYPSILINQDVIMQKEETK